MYVNPLGASKKRSSDTHIGIAPAPHHHSLSALPASDQPVAAFEAPYGSAPVLRVLRDRFGVLASLLVLQSLSSIVLQRYEQLLEHHIEITLFLTMVVGAGGNASNQSAVDVIRGLATGAIRPWSSSTSSGETMGLFSVLKRELHIGLMLALALFVITFIRVFVAVQGSFITVCTMALAISFALLVIVLLAVIAGALLPFLLQRCGLDPAHAGPSCQVLMDVFGVFCVCFVCDHILASAPTPAPTVAAPLS